MGIARRRGKQEVPIHMGVISFHEPERRPPAQPVLGANYPRRRAGGRRSAPPRFMVPMHSEKRMGALHEPQGAAGILPAEWSEKSSAGKMPAALWRHRLSSSRFMVPMHGIKVVGAFHEPECSAGFPACGFTGLSSPVDQRRATRKSPEPAGWKACATSQSWFTIPMHAKKRKGAPHEPRSSECESAHTQ